MAVGWELIVPRMVREGSLKELPARLASAGAEAVVVRSRGLAARAVARPPVDFTERGYLDALAERVLVFDGAMGTEVQKHNLGADRFRR